MDKSSLINLLELVKNGEVNIEDAVSKLSDLPYKDMGYANIDNHRELRVGYPEVIYCGGKTVDQVKGIFEFMATKDCNILGTRATEEMYNEVKKVCEEAEYNKIGRTIIVKRKEMQTTESYIAIVAAGTSDLPVVEEAYETARIFGNKVEKIVDVGVAGIHRLFNRLELIKGAKVIIVIAGMEGALASVIGGLVDKPIIGVPTSVGYGTNFGGVAALLSMLNSCSSGISVVNIDNGFGAAYQASMINKL